MAKLGGFIRKFTGTIGNVTFKQLNGQTVASEKVESKANPKRTYSQMVRRVQWANLVNLYRAFEGHLHPSFENKDAKVSDFNEFVSANFGLIPVYLTKSDARQGGVVVAGYQITRGSLPSIALTDAMGGEVTTDISMGGITIGATTTVKQFSDAVVNNNPDYQNGDEITVFIVEQLINSETQVPYVKVFTEQITLDQTDSTTKVRDIVAASGFSIVDGNLGTSSSIDGAVAYVHSRKSGSNTRVSTQRLKASNSHLATFQTPEALSLAIKSYAGDVSEKYLTPDE